MAGNDRPDFGSLIDCVEIVKGSLEVLNNESNLTIIRHKTTLEKMVEACSFLVTNIRVIEVDLRAS
ncbi:hypothetical protein LCGC14_1605850 [marine sediment metagenome]|uniref:Uncharacterized protein n=1 Tax=marine sediment metagenome TaxID=412755 RepID=A0A0F9IWE4_9ZZZZ